MKQLFILFKSLFAWKTVDESNCYVYQQNTITNKRRIVRKPESLGLLIGPPDSLWLKGYARGETFRRMGNPPCGKGYENK